MHITYKFNFNLRAQFKLTGVKIPKIGTLHFPAKNSSEKLKICKDDLALWQVEGSPGLPDFREKINWKNLNLQFFRRIFRGEMHISQGIFGIRVYENPCVKYSSFILCCVPVRSFTHKINLSLDRIILIGGVLWDYIRLWTFRL